MDWSGDSGQYQVHQITFCSYLVHLSGNLRSLLPPYLTSPFCCQMKLDLRNRNQTATAAVLAIDAIAIKDGTSITMRQKVGIMGFYSQYNRDR